MKWLGTAVFSLALAGCAGSPAYYPTTSTMDIRTAQETVRSSLMQRVAFVIGPSGDATRINDVRFRNDGFGVLFQQSGEAQAMQACYYSNFGQIYVNHVPMGRDGFGGATYAVRFCHGLAAAAWFSSEQDARQLADAIFALTKSRR